MVYFKNHQLKRAIKSVNKGVNNYLFIILVYNSKNICVTLINPTI